MDQDPLIKTKISDSDKPESLACDEDTEWVKCDFQMSVLTLDIISICFTQPATVGLTTALCGFMKLTKNWEAWFSSPQTEVISI